MLKRTFLGVLAVLGLIMPGPAILAQTGISQKVAVCDPSYPGRCIKPAANGSIAITGGGGGGGASVTATAAAPTYVEGSTTNNISSNLKAGIRFVPVLPAALGGTEFDLSAPATLVGKDGTTIATVANPLPTEVEGSVVLGAGSATVGTVNLGTIGGTATAANQTTANSSLSSIDTKLTSPLTVSLPTGAATAANQTTANSSLSSIDTKLTSPLTVNLPTGAATEASLVKLPVAQGSTTSGQSGPIVQCATTTAAPTYTTAQTNPLSCDTTGNVRVASTVSQATASNLNAQVVGNIASAATDSGNPVKLGCVYNSTQPTFTTGQRGDCQLGSRGAILVQVMAQDATTTPAMTTSGSDAIPNARAGFISHVFNYGFNGTSWDRLGTLNDSAVSAGTGVVATHAAPNTAAASAIVPVVSGAAEGSHILKASAGNLYRVSITTGGTAGYLMVFNATTAPADGAVTPTVCRIVAANSSLELDWSVVPKRLGTGITAVFSSTGCFTKTISATAMLEGDVE